MAVSLPQFNLLMDIWTIGTTPAVDPPAFTGVPVQVYVRSKADIDTYQVNIEEWIPPIYLRHPLGGPKLGRGDIVQVLHLPLDYYLVVWCQNLHMGFPNEYYQALSKQCDDTGAVPRP